MYTTCRVHTQVYMYTHSVEDSHEFHESLSSALISANAFNLRFYLTEKHVQGLQNTHHLFWEGMDGWMDGWQLEDGWMDGWQLDG